MAGRRKNNDEPVAFDHDVDGFDDISPSNKEIENDDLFDDEPSDNRRDFTKDVDEYDTAGIQDARGESALSSFKALKQKGQKPLVLSLLFLAVTAAGALTYRLASSGGSSEEEVAQESTNVNFTKPAERTFGEQFYDLSEPNPHTTELQPLPELQPIETPVEPTENLEGLQPVEPPQVVVEQQPPPVIEQPQPAPIIAPQPVIEAAAPPPPSPEELREARIYASGFKGIPKGANARVSSNEPRSDAARADSKLSKALQPVKLDAAAAGVLPNKDYLLTRGNMIDCVLDTKFNSTVLGMVSCTVTRNIYSSSGRVVLVDRGSRVTGQYSGGLKQGSNRVFVLWNRIETPKGVIIDINSPGTSPLGEAGMTGHVDTKFFARFGGAMLISLIDDVGEAVAAAIAEKATDRQVSLESTSETAEDMSKAALEKMIDIPPVLTKHQGDRVSIYVARDMYFGGVYDLASVTR